MKQKHGNDTFTDEELIEAYKTYETLGKIAEYFNVPKITIHRRSAKIGLVYKNGGHNKGNYMKFPLEDILNGMYPQYSTFKLKNRLINENILEYKCSLCEISEWRGNKITLQLDHINGNNHDHTLKNLRLVCPNCHSQTDTYCGKNIPLDNHP